MLVTLSVRGVDRDHGRVPGAAEAAGVVRSRRRRCPRRRSSASSAGIATGSSCQCTRSGLTAWPHEMLPHGVAGRVVLEEQVVLAAVVDQPVGVVHPVLGGREVELRSVGLRVRHRRGRRRRVRLRGHGGGDLRCGEKCCGCDDGERAGEVTAMTPSGRRSSCGYDGLGLDHRLPLGSDDEAHGSVHAVLPGQP